MSERATPDYQALKARVRELAKGPADRAAVEAKLRKLSQEGIPKRCSTGMRLLPTSKRFWNRSMT